MKITLTYLDEDGDELAFEAPAKYEVCERCHGTGKHVNPSVDGHGITDAEFADDPDFADDYYSGRYDVTCEVCGGKRVALCLDYDEAALDPDLAKDLSCFEKYAEWKVNYAAECAAERRMGY